MWVLDTEAESFARAESALKCGAISLAPTLLSETVSYWDGELAD